MTKQKNEGDGNLNLSAIEADVLTVLLARELYGLDILNRINPGRPIPLSFGSLYPALNRLEKKGFIDWRWGDEQEGSGGARRKYYKVTGLGETTLNLWLVYRAGLQGGQAWGGA